MPWARGRTLCEEEKSGDMAAAREKALDLLTGRDFAAEELYERLTRRFAEPAAAAAVAAVQQLGLLDDARYARQKVRSLQLQHKSRRAIAEALRTKGIDKALIGQVLEEAYAPPADADGETADPELAAARALVERQYARKLAAGRDDLVLAALLRRGFAYRTARQAIAAAAKEETN